MKIETQLKKWGNSLALRVTGVMAELPEFHDGSKVTVEVTEEGFTVTPAKEDRRSLLPYTEEELLTDMSLNNSHADDLATLTEVEYGE